MHLIMQELRTSAKVMAKNQEKYRSLDIGRFQIRDSIEHIPSSLEALVNDLRKDKNFTFPLLNQFDFIKNFKAKKKITALNMLKKKGVYPYEYFKNFKSLQSTKKISSKRGILFKFKRNAHKR